MQNNKGSAIVAVISTTAIVGVILSNFFTLLQSTQKINRLSMQNYYANQIQLIAKRALGNNEICRTNFNVDPTTTHSFTQLTSPYSATPIFAANQEFGRRDIIFKSMELRPFGPEHLQLNLYMEKIGGYIGSQQLVRSIKIRFDGSPITDCMEDSSANLSVACASINGTLDGIVCKNPYIPQDPGSSAPGSITSAGNISIAQDAISAFDMNTVGTLSTNTMESNNASVSGTTGAQTIQTQHIWGPATVNINGDLSLSSQACTAGSCINTFIAPPPCGVNQYLQAINADGTIVCGTFL